MTGDRLAVERARANATKARRKLLQRRRELRAVHRSNQARMGDESDGTQYSPTGVDPTTASRTAGKHSSVPTSGDRATSFERLYGRRLDDHESQA